MGDGETYSGDKANWRRHPDPTEENIARVLAGGEPAEAEPPGMLGELVRIEPDAATFLVGYSTSDLGGEGRVDGINLQEPLKKGLHSLSDMYHRGHSIKELQQLIDEMRALGRTDDYSLKALSIYQDFVDYLASHDLGYEIEVAVEKAKALEETETRDTKPIEAVEEAREDTSEEIPEETSATPPATFASTQSFLTPDEQQAFQDITEDFRQADSIRIPRGKPSHRRSGKHGQ